jgi:DNA (cytosine-5)-methyltransferase 1
MNAQVQNIRLANDENGRSEQTADLACIPLVIGVDLFAGAGGFSCAAGRAGIHIAAAVELNPSACRTYSLNFVKDGVPSPHLFPDDIRKLDPSAILQVPVLAENGCDILIGGPPCQGFSAHRINDSGVGDPRNELLIRYFDFVQALQPKVFLVENVPGLLWPRHAHFLQRFLTLATEFGYDIIGPMPLNARDYGVPQNRRRVFILGIRRGTGLAVAWPPEKTHRAPGSDDDGRPEWRPASDAFDSPIPADDPNGNHMKHTPEMTAYLESVLASGGNRRGAEHHRTLPCHKGHSGHSDVYGSINPERSAPTMTTACINPSKGRFVHPKEPHGITLRHAARLQSFPDDFIFEGGLMAGGVQVGNAVPVLMGQRLLAPIADAIRDWKLSRGSQ